MGNIHVETGGSFDSTQKQYRDGPGRGLFQMEPGSGKLDEYQIWLEKTGRGDTADNQIQFFRDTIYDPKGIRDIVGRDVAGFGNARRLREVFESSDDPEEVARAVTELWEKPGVPHLDRRQEAALSFMDSETADSGIAERNYQPSGFTGLFEDRFQRMLKAFSRTPEATTKLTPEEDEQFDRMLSDLTNTVRRRLGGRI